MAAASKIDGGVGFFGPPWSFSSTSRIRSRILLFRDMKCSPELAERFDILRTEEELAVPSRRHHVTSRVFSMEREDHPKEQQRRRQRQLGAGEGRRRGPRERDHRCWPSSKGLSPGIVENEPVGYAPPPSLRRDDVLIGRRSGGLASSSSASLATRRQIGEELRGNTSRLALFVSITFRAGYPGKYENSSLPL